MSYKVDVVGTSNLKGVAQDVKSFADTVKTAASTASSSANQFKSLGPPIQQVGAQMKTIPSTASQMNSALTQMQGALRGMGTALTGGASGMKAFQGSLGPTNTLLGQVTNTAAQTQAALNRMVGTAGPLANTFTSTNSAIQRFTGSLQMMNTQTTATTGSLTRYLTPLNQTTSATNTAATATGNASTQQAGFAKNTAASIIPMVGMFNAVTEAVGMFQLYQDSLAKVNELQAEKTALEEQGMESTQEYRQVTNELEQAQRGLSFIFRNTMQSIIDIGTFAALLVNQFTKASAASKELAIAQTELGAASQASGGLMAKFGGVLSFLTSPIGIVVAALVALAGALIALRLNVGGITDRFREMGAGLGQAVPPLQGFLQALESTASVLGIITPPALKFKASMTDVETVLQRGRDAAKQFEEPIDKLRATFSSWNTDMNTELATLNNLTKQLDEANKKTLETADARRTADAASVALSSSEGQLDQSLLSLIPSMIDVARGSVDVAEAQKAGNEVTKQTNKIDELQKAILAEVGAELTSMVGPIRAARVEQEGLGAVSKVLADVWQKSNPAVYAMGMQKVTEASQAYSAALDVLKPRLDNFDGTLEEARITLGFVSDTLVDTTLNWESFPTVIQASVTEIGKFAQENMTAADKMAVLNAAIQGHDAALRKTNPQIADMIARIREYIASVPDAATRSQMWMEFMFQLAEALGIAEDAVPPLVAATENYKFTLIDSSAAVTEHAAALQDMGNVTQQIATAAAQAWAGYKDALIEGKIPQDKFVEGLKTMVENGQMNAEVADLLAAAYKEFTKLVQEGVDPIKAWPQALANVTAEMQTTDQTIQAAGISIEDFGSLVTTAMSDVNAAVEAGLPMWTQLSTTINEGGINANNYKTITAALSDEIKNNTTLTEDQRAGYKLVTDAMNIAFKIAGDGVVTQKILNDAWAIATGTMKDYTGEMGKGNSAAIDYEAALKQLETEIQNIMTSMTDAATAQDALTVAMEEGKKKALEFVSGIKTSNAETESYRANLIALSDGLITAQQAQAMTNEEIENTIAIAQGSREAIEELAISFAELGKGALKMSQDLDIDDWADDFGDALDDVADDFDDLADDLGLDESNAGIVDLRFQAETEEFQKALKEIAPLVVEAIKQGESEFTNAVRENMIMPMIEEVQDNGTPQMQAAAQKFLGAFDTAVAHSRDTNSPIFRQAIGDMVNAMIGMKTPMEDINGLLNAFGLTIDDVQGAADGAADGIDGMTRSIDTLDQSTRDAIESARTLMSTYKDTVAAAMGIDQTKLPKEPKVKSKEELEALFGPGGAEAPKQLPVRGPAGQDPAAAAQQWNTLATTAQTVAKTVSGAFSNMAMNISLSLGTLDETFTILLTAFQTFATTSQSMAITISGSFSNMAMNINLSLATIDEPFAILLTAFQTFTTTSQSMAITISGSFSNMAMNILLSLSTLDEPFAILLTALQTFATTSQTSAITISGSFSNMAMNILLSLSTLDEPFAILLTAFQTFATESQTMATTISGSFSNTATNVHASLEKIVSDVAKVGDQILPAFAKSVQSSMQQAASHVSKFASDFASSMSKVESDAKKAEAAVKALQKAIDSLKDKTVTVTYRQKTVGSAPKGYQHGGTFIAQQPTMFMVGEARRKERIQVKPGVGEFASEKMDRRRRVTELSNMLSNIPIAVGMRGAGQMGAAGSTGRGGGGARGGVIHEKPIEIVLMLPDREITRVVKKIMWQETSGGYSQPN